MSSKPLGPMSPARRTALFSLVAAFCLAAAKLGVGLATGSLGILAEAAHSAVDMAAALIAYLAVTVAERPADPEHQYGHGKAQNLSALAEAAILGGVAIYIGVEAILRLTESNPPTVNAAWYAFVLDGRRAGGGREPSRHRLASGRPRPQRGAVGQRVALRLGLRRDHGRADRARGRAGRPARRRCGGRALRRGAGGAGRRPARGRQPGAR